MVLANIVHQFVVEQVAFGDGKHTRLVGKVGIKCGKFVAQHVIFVANVIAVGRYHEQQYRIALDVVS